MTRGNDMVDDDVVWKIVMEDLPHLRQQVEILLSPADQA